MSKRIKTKYPGVFYREAQRIAGPGIERVYYVVFKKAGKLFEEKVGRQYVDAMTPAKAARIRAERIEGKRLSKKQEREKVKRDSKTVTWTVDKIWDEYKRQRPEIRGLSIDEHRYKKYLKPNFEQKEPKDVLQSEVDKLRLKTMKALSDQSKRHVLALLRRIVNFGVRKKLCEPLSFTMEMPTVRNQKTEDLTDEQLAALLKAIDGEKNIQVANLMKMALFTGMRRGELFRLQWSDVNFHRGFINILDPKGGQNQRIPLNDAARHLLKNHIRTESEFIFPGRGGRQRKTISATANDIKTKAGLPKDFRPLHGLRHVYASMLASSGQVDLYTLQKLLTHKNPAMTQRYAHLRDSALQNAANLAGKLINEIVKKNRKVKDSDENKGNVG